MPMHQNQPHPDDKTLSCKDCGSSFVFSKGEQDFYKSKGFDNQPTRCPKCRSAKKARFDNGR